MKRYLLFYNSWYYPDGGMKDFMGSYNTQEEAIEHMSTIKIDWWHLYDSQEGKIVLDYQNGRSILDE